MLNAKWLREHTRIPRIIIEFVDDFDNYSVSYMVIVYNLA